MNSLLPDQGTVVARLARRVISATIGASREEALLRIEARLAMHPGPADAAALELSAVGSGGAGRG